MIRVLEPLEITLVLGIQSVVSAHPAALASPGSLLEMQNPRPYPRTTE